jgi:hypothetical protein
VHRILEEKERVAGTVRTSASRARLTTDTILKFKACEIFLLSSSTVISSPAVGLSDLVLKTAVFVAASWPKWAASSFFWILRGTDLILRISGSNLPERK